MIAESGRMRRAALRDAVARQPQFAHRGQAALIAHPMDSRRPPPPVAPRGGARLLGTRLPQIVEFLCGPIGFALLRQHVGDRGAQLDEQLHIQGGVVEPFGGQRALGPVGRAVALGQPEAQQPLDHGRQVHPLEPGQPPGQLGVIQRRWPHAHLRQTGQVLIRGVQDPLVAAEHLGHRPQRPNRVGAVAHRVDQHGAGPGPADLDQVGPVGVAESRRPLGVHRERPAAAVQPPRRVLDVGDAGRDRRDAFGRVRQRDGSGHAATRPLGRRFAHARRVTASSGR